MDDVNNDQCSLWEDRTKLILSKGGRVRRNKPTGLGSLLESPWMSRYQQGMDTIHQGHLVSVHWVLSNINQYPISAQLHPEKEMCIIQAAN